MRGQVRGVEYLGFGWGPPAGLGTAVGGGDNKVYQTELVKWKGTWSSMSRQLWRWTTSARWGVMLNRKSRSIKLDKADNPIRPSAREH